MPLDILQIGLRVRVCRIESLLLLGPVLEFVLHLHPLKAHSSLKLGRPDRNSTHNGDRFAGFDNLFDDEAIAQNAHNHDPHEGHAPDEKPLYAPFPLQARTLLARQFL